MIQHPIVSHNEWIEARKALLAREKEYTRAGDALSAARRSLPWVKVDTDYVFEGPDGEQTLGDLFGGRSQLIVYHFMFGPGWTEGCPSCSLVADHFDGANLHLAHHDVALVAVSRAPWKELQPFKDRMGWQFRWVSSHGNSFNHDYRVSFQPDDIHSGKVDYNYGPQDFDCEEMPGLSVFIKDEDGSIFHTYSTYTRGLDVLIGVHNFLDLTPKGRDEAHPMSWVRHHDRYETEDGDDRHSLDVGTESAGCCDARAETSRA